MPEDEVGERRTSAPQMSGLRKLIEDVQAMAPQRLEAFDRTGAVRVVLGSDGQPELIEVEHDWRDRLRPDSFGQAVLGASQTATDDRSAAWAHRLADPAWQAEVESLPDIAAGEPIRLPDLASATPAASPSEPSDVDPRDSRAVTAEIVHAVENIDEMVAASLAVQGVGSAAFGKLVVTLSRDGLVSCTADPGWLSQRSGEELTEALGAALTSARADLARNAEATAAGRLNRLLAKALAPGPTRHEARREHGHGP
jgi:hypothetical protein